MGLRAESFSSQRLGFTVIYGFKLGYIGLMEKNIEATV